MKLSVKDVEGGVVLTFVGKYACGTPMYTCFFHSNDESIATLGRRLQIAAPGIARQAARNAHEPLGQIKAVVRDANSWPKIYLVEERDLNNFELQQHVECSDASDGTEARTKPESPRPMVMAINYPEYLEVAGVPDDWVVGDWIWNAGNRPKAATT